MPQLGLASFTENQDRLVVPMKPDRPRLGCIVGIDGGEPDYLAPGYNFTLARCWYSASRFGGCLNGKHPFIHSAE